MTYQEFLTQKELVVPPAGIEPGELNKSLFQFQSDIVSWSLRCGRSAIFSDCGTGKTPMQLSWAEQVPKRKIVLCPLAVAQQTVREGLKFGIDVTHLRDGDDGVSPIIVTNYERLHYFDPSKFNGIVLDESSILKSFDSATRKEIGEFSQNIPFKLACTATPAPNDLIELTNHSEYLGIMSGKEIIALFFKQDGNTTHQWRLKGHAKGAFFKWLSQWAVGLRAPSDLGYSDDGFILPKLNMNHITVNGHILEGHLFPVLASTLSERRESRKASLVDRVGTASEMVNLSDEQWLAWCDLNIESEALTKSIDGAVEVKGSDSPEHKEWALNAFALGEIRVLVTKPSIAAWGMNFQNCHNMVFVGLSDSYEQFYQGTRRCWRFGQKHPVNVHIITADTEGAVVANIERKSRQAQEMFDQLIKEMDIYNTINQTKTQIMDYQEKDKIGDGWKFMLGDSCERIKEIKDESIGLSVFSPPFPGMYVYSNSPRDVGNIEDIDGMISHFRFLMPELLRVTMPGRMACVHLMQLTAMKSREGYIGLKDYRGAVISMMIECGWVYAGEVTIDKNPQVQAVRNKERGLMFKTLANDSSLMRMALADYVIYFRKPGENPIPIRAGISEKYKNPDGWITEEEWIEWASPVWYRRIDKENEGRRATRGYPGSFQVTDGIMETDVLNVACARDDKDERHLCPLQLGVIERCVKLWSAPGDTVLSPFGGIASEGCVAVRLNRSFIGIELKESYWKQGCANLAGVERESQVGDLFNLQKTPPISKSVLHISDEISNNHAPVE